MSRAMPPAAERAILIAIADGATVDQMIDRRGLAADAIRQVMARHDLEVDGTGRLVAVRHTADWAFTLAQHSTNPMVRREALAAHAAYKRLQRTLATTALGKNAIVARGDQNAALNEWRGVLRELLANVNGEIADVRRRSDARMVASADRDVLARLTGNAAPPSGLAEHVEQTAPAA